ncbi:coiled-coil domain-containing protein 55-domain containing protein, partial [Tribonema minus]
MKRYGLLGNAKTLKAQSVAAKTAKAPRKAPARGPAVAAFGDDSDSDGGAGAEDPTSRAAVNRRLAAEQAERARRMEKVAVQAVMDDPSVFDYDGVYDEVSKGRDDKAAAAAAARGNDKTKRLQPRYIGNLLEQAKLRTVEQDRVYDRKLAKEREEGDKEFGAAEMKFVTSAYKAKLMEQKKWEVAQEREAEREAQAEADMKRGGGMTAFYSNLLTKNIAMGGDVANATSAFTAGSRRHAAAAAFKVKAD